MEHYVSTVTLFHGISGQSDLDRASPGDRIANHQLPHMLNYLPVCTILLYAVTAAAVLFQFDNHQKQNHS